MPEKFSFDPEKAALRAELVGNLKIDKNSEESKRLLNQWAEIGEDLILSGSLDSFQWNKEEVEVYLDAELNEEAIWVMENALYEAQMMGRLEEEFYFRDRLAELGVNPDTVNAEMLEKENLKVQIRQFLKESKLNVNDPDLTDEERKNRNRQIRSFLADRFGAAVDDIDLEEFLL
jgi:hypothetical protein